MRCGYLVKISFVDEVPIPKNTTLPYLDIYTLTKGEYSTAKQHFSSTQVVFFKKALLTTSTPQLFEATRRPQSWLMLRNLRTFPRVCLCPTANKWAQRALPPMRSGSLLEFPLIDVSAMIGQIESNYDESTDSFDAMNLKPELLRGM